MTIVALEQTRSTNEERSETVFYGGYDYQLGKDRMEQARSEIERNRLRACLAKGNSLEEPERGHRSAVARGTALVAAFLR
jgi:hypothetical protein